MSPGYMESTFARMADRAMRKKAALAALPLPSLPPSPGRWMIYRSIHGANWHSFTEMGKLANTSRNAANFQVKRYPERWEKRRQGIRVLVRVKQVAEK